MTAATYGLDPQHCRCCETALRIARAVDHPRPGHLSTLAPKPVAGHCGCCDAGISQLDYNRRNHDRLAGDYRRELDRGSRTYRLLAAALRLIPPDTRLPEDLEAEWADIAHADAVARQDLRRAKEQRDILQDGVTRLLWGIQGPPSNSGFTYGHVKLDADEPLKGVASWLERLLGAASAQRNPHPDQATPLPRQPTRRASTPPGGQAALDLEAAS